MSDPYNILGIGRNASDDEVKKAYREMARKYHPDKNPGNQAAEEMFKIVQDAYREIMDERKNGGSTFGTGTGAAGGFRQDAGAGYGAGGNYYGPAENATRYQAAANYINNGYFREAFNVLTNVKERDAMWYYLSALTNAGLGNNYEAMRQASTAVQMEPGNPMYQELVSRLSYGGMNYYSRQQGMTGGSTSGADYCANLCALNICLNLCCDVSCCC